MEPVPVNIQIRIALLKQGMSQMELAWASELSESRISRIIRGRYKPTFAERARIAVALAVAEDELFPATTMPKKPEDTD